MAESLINWEEINKKLALFNKNHKSSHIEKIEDNSSSLNIKKKENEEEEQENKQSLFEVLNVGDIITRSFIDEKKQALINQINYKISKSVREGEKLRKKSESKKPHQNRENNHKY